MDTINPRCVDNIDSNKDNPQFANKNAIDLRGGARKYGQEKQCIDSISFRAKKKVGYRFVKRLFDITFSLIGIPILVIITIPVSIAIMIEDGFPIFFSQERTGLYGKSFTLYKYRSMCKAAVDMHNDLIRENELDGPIFKMKEDPRVTKVGRFLRRSSLDELPQLINILKGEMSFVGPRPLPVYESKRCDDQQMKRYSIKPGLTCYWQCMGRNNIPFGEWMRLDLKYLEDAGFWTDIKIILKTVIAVVKQDGAF